MPHQVVGFVASPRKGMNTDTLVTAALEGARSAGAITEKIYLNDLDIRPCQACDDSPAPDHCHYHDGMDVVYQAIETADGLVIGTPAYYDSISAQLKLVIDRSNCLTEMIPLVDGSVVFRSRIAKRKKAVLIWVADFSRNPEHAQAMLRHWSSDANVDLIDSMAVTGSDRGGGARNREDLLHRAFELGIVLEREPRRSQAPS